MERRGPERKRASGGAISIKGFLPSGMLDWPGRIASTIFTAKCNFRCPFCHNTELVENYGEYPDIDVDALLDYLADRKMWVEAVVITGGEPTVWPGLDDFLEKLKNIGLDVKLDTNGTRPARIERLISRGLVDFVAMDIKTSFEKYPEAVRAPVAVDDIKKSVQLIVDSGVEHEFRMTVVPSIHNAKIVADASRELAELGAKKLVIQQFQNKTTLDKSFQNLSPFSKAELDSIVAKASKYLEVSVRGE